MISVLSIFRHFGGIGKTQKNDYNVLDWWDNRKKRNFTRLFKDYGFEKYNREKKYKNQVQKDLTKHLNASNSDLRAISEIERKIKGFEMKDFEKTRVKLHIHKMVDEKPSNFFFFRTEQNRGNHNHFTCLIINSTYYSNSLVN